MARIALITGAGRGIGRAIATAYADAGATEGLFGDPATLAAPLHRTPLGRFPEAEDIAATALYLASDAARNVSAKVIAVDGGRTAT